MCTWQKACSHAGAWRGSCRTPPQIAPEKILNFEINIDYIWNPYKLIPRQYHLEIVGYQNPSFSSILSAHLQKNVLHEKLGMCLSNDHVIGWLIRMTS